MILIGHRGAKNEAPENTLMGFKHLKNLGIQNVEFDLHLSADQELVIIHDKTLERTTNGTGLVRTKTAKELKLLDACSYFSKNITAEGVPTLKEVLSVFDQLEHAQLEVKPPRFEDHQIICNKIKQTLDELNLLQQCVVTSFDYSFLESCKHYQPELKRGFLCEKKGAALMDPVEATLKLECQLLAIDWQLCTEEMIQRAHKNHLQISVWTVDDEKVFKQLMAWGIDSIITNCPSKFIPLID